MQQPNDPAKRTVKTFFDMNEAVVNEGVLSDGEKRRLLKLRREAHEIVTTVTDRIEIMTDSMEASQRRFEEARILAQRSTNLYHEAMIALAEDEADDFGTAVEKIEKFETIESDYLVSGKAYESALIRLGWEIKNSGAESE